MKKLLNILSVFLLTATTVTSVVICGNPIKPILPIPIEKIDISNKIPSSILIEQLSENTKLDFLSKLQSKLAFLTDLSSITVNDYDVYKAGTTTVIQDGDIIAGISLNIKIVAKGTKFEGNKDNIIVNYTQKYTKIDISNKIPSSILIEQLSENTKLDFLSKLQSKLTFLTDLSSITVNDYDVYKAGTTTVIQDGDISAGISLNIKIVAKGTKFEGNKDNIIVNYIQKYTKIDISNKIPSSILIEQLFENTTEGFLLKLENKLSKINELKNITTDDYDTYKYGTKNLIKDNDINTNTSIVIDIKIKKSSTYFTGQANNINVFYMQNENNKNLIEKDYRFLAHDWIKLKLSSNIFLDIKNKFNYQNQEESKKTILKSISDFPKSDNTGWGGSITKEDFDTITNCIFENFREINNFFEKLQKGQGLLIVTNTIDSWDKNDDMGVFKQFSSDGINLNLIITGWMAAGISLGSIISIIMSQPSVLSGSLLLIIEQMGKEATKGALEGDLWMAWSKAIDDVTIAMQSGADDEEIEFLWRTVVLPLEENARTGVLSLAEELGATEALETIVTTLSTETIVESSIIVGILGSSAAATLGASLAIGVAIYGGYYCYEHWNEMKKWLNF